MTAKKKNIEPGQHKQSLRTGKEKETFPLSKLNYKLMIAGVVLIIIGFVLMTGGGSDDPNVFNGEELFSFRRITLAPIIVFLGFALEIVAIMIKPKEEN